MDVSSIYPDVQRYFPAFDYRAPAGDRAVLCDYRHPANMVGHQQRAFSCYWALRQCSMMDLGLDLGSPRGLTPFCIHVDVFGTGAPHPFYPGGPYLADVVADASSLGGTFPQGAFNLVNSNHSLEHMSGDPVTVLQHWVSLLRQGGVLALVIPDNDYNDVLAMDKDHRHAWSAGDFKSRVLDHVQGIVVEEYDTFQNHFSFNIVARKA